MYHIILIKYFYIILIKYNYRQQTIIILLCL